MMQGELSVCCSGTQVAALMDIMPKRDIGPKRGAAVSDQASCD